MYRLSKKFCTNWINRYGFAPDEDDINLSLKQGVVIQKFIVFENGKKETVFKVPELVLDLDKRICLKVDKSKNVVFEFTEV